MLAMLELEFKEPKKIKKAIGPEINSKIKDGKLLIKISANNFSSLRAKLTSTLRLLHVAKEILE